MKKILTHLTGIVFVLTILLAGSCNPGTKKEGAEEANGGTPQVQKDPKKVDIFLKESSIDGTMHLFIYDSKKPDCGVIDDHLIVVKGGCTIKWKNAQGSKIDEIIHIRTVGGDGTFFGAVPEIENAEADTVAFLKGIHKLVLPDSIPSDTLVKYEIGFTVKGHKDTIYNIDPYLKIPPKR